MVKNLLDNAVAEDCELKGYIQSFAESYGKSNKIAADCSYESLAKWIVLEYNSMREEYGMHFGR